MDLEILINLSNAPNNLNLNTCITFINIMKRPKYKIIQIEELKNILLTIFKNYKEIQIAYLYGSYAQGNRTEYSDIDIGIIIKREFKESPLYFAELSSKIEEYFNYKVNIDLRILNKATPRFLFNVINEGIPLFIRDYTFFYEFELKVMSMYQEIKPMLDMYDEQYISEALNDERET